MAILLTSFYVAYTGIITLNLMSKKTIQSVKYEHEYYYDSDISALFFCKKIE